MKPDFVTYANHYECETVIQGSQKSKLFEASINKKALPWNRYAYFHSNSYLILWLTWSSESLQLSPFFRRVQRLKCPKFSSEIHLPRNRSITSEHKPYTITLPINFPCPSHVILHNEKHPIHSYKCYQHIFRHIFLINIWTFERKLNCRHAIHSLYSVQEWRLNFWTRGGHFSCESNTTNIMI